MSIPVELWRPIIAHVPAKHDLATLAQVSRLFQLEAERVLYRALILHHADDALPHALAVSRRRALLVHECSLYLPAAPRKSHALLAALARMRNLHTLSIRGPLPAAAAKGLALPFRLRTFCTTEPLSRPLIALLRAQPSITRLTLLHPSPAPAPPALAAALPNAHALATLTPAPALAILPHRPVTHLHILAWARAPLTDVAPRLGASAGPLRALMCAEGLDLAPADLGLLAMHIPNLAFLGDCRLTAPLPAYLPALAALPLRTLLVNRASPGLPARFSEPALVRALGAACKRLDRVVFTQRVTAGYVWHRDLAAAADWRIVPVDDPCEVAADLWRAA